MTEFPNIKYQEFNENNDNHSINSEDSYKSHDEFRNTMYLSANTNNDDDTNNVSDSIHNHINENQYSVQANYANSLCISECQNTDNLLINNSTQFYRDNDNIDYISYNENKDNYMFNRINNHLTESQDILRNNINKVIDRNIKINKLSENSDSLLNNATKFKNTSRTLKYKMFKKYILHILSLFILIVLIIVLIIILIK